MLTKGAYCAQVDHKRGTMLTAGREHPVLDTIDLKPALRLALALERAPMGVIMLQDELSGHLYPALSQGLTAQQCTEFGVHRPGVGPVGLAFSQHERVTVDVLADGAADLKRHAGAKARRWVVERTHSWMNRFRRLLIRWDKKVPNYKAFLHLACACITYQAAGVLG